MTGPSRALTTRVLVFAVLALSATCLAQTRPPIAEKISDAYGFDSWNQIDAIRYTWNAQLPGVNLSHTWEWHPKTGEVTFETKDKDGKPEKVTYVQSQIDSAPPDVKDQVNPSFVNDQYWLLLPLHVSWDTSATVQDDGTKKVPIGAGTATLVSLKYPPSAGGFTPGDTWDLYVGPEGRLEDMVYHRGGPKKPSLVTVTWAGYKKAGPLVFSTEHRGTADGKPFRVFFTDVAVKVAGSDSWVDAQ